MKDIYSPMNSARTFPKLVDSTGPYCFASAHLRYCSPDLHSGNLFRFGCAGHETWPKQENPCN